MLDNRSVRILWTAGYGMQRSRGARGSAAVFAAVCAEGEQRAPAPKYSANRSGPPARRAAPREVSPRDGVTVLEDPASIISPEGCTRSASYRRRRTARYGGVRGLSRAGAKLRHYLLDFSPDLVRSRAVGPQLLSFERGQTTEYV